MRLLLPRALPPVGRRVADGRRARRLVHPRCGRAARRGQLRRWGMWRRRHNGAERVPVQGASRLVRHSGLWRGVLWLRLLTAPRRRRDDRLPDGRLRRGRRDDAKAGGAALDAR